MNTDGITKGFAFPSLFMPGVDAIINNYAIKHITAFGVMPRFKMHDASLNFRGT